MNVQIAHCQLWEFWISFQDKIGQIENALCVEGPKLNTLVEPEDR